MPFDETRWSLVLRAASHGDGAQEALASLYQSYWPPLYSFLRARGHTKENAADLLQGFFLVSIEKNYFLAANPEAGRFRTFLLTALTRYVANDRARKDAQKRGGRIAHIRIDSDVAEGMHQRIPSNVGSPEQLFDRQWALGILARALETLENEYRKSGRGDVYDALRTFLVGAGAEPADPAMASSLGLTPAMRVALHRLRNRYRKTIEEIIAETVAVPDDVDDELKYLIAVLRNIP